MAKDVLNQFLKNMEGPKIPREGVEATLKEMKKNKATGSDTHSSKRNDTSAGDREL